MAKKSLRKSSSKKSSKKTAKKVGKKTTSKKVAKKKSASKKIVSKKAASKKALGKKVSTKKSAPKKTVQVERTVPRYQRVSTGELYDFHNFGRMTAEGQFMGVKKIDGGNIEEILMSDLVKLD